MPTDFVLAGGGGSPPRVCCAWMSFGWPLACCCSILALLGKVGSALAVVAAGAQRLEDFESMVVVCAGVVGL